MKGISIQAVPVKQDRIDGKTSSEHVTVYSMGIEGVFVGHLGALNRSLKEAELESLGRIDVLLLPVGGGHVLSAKAAVDIMTQLEPRIVIPCHYAMKELKLDATPLETFLKESGMKVTETTDKAKITKKDLPAEETSLIVLNLA